MIDAILKIALALAWVASVATPARAEPGAVTVTVAGRVIDRAGRPVGGASVVVEGTAARAVTDRGGRYRIDGVAIGATLIVDRDGFETGLGTVAGTEVDDVVLANEAGATETIEIHGKRPPSSPGATLLDREEAERIPGTGGDVVRTLSALPGVANTQLPTGLSGIVIRGSAPQDSKILIDDFEVPLLYHSIAFRAILPTEAIESLDYIPGGFDVAYGRAGSGIVALKTRAGGDHASEQAELSLLDAGALIQGPAGPDLRYMLSVRRSTIDLVLPYVIPASANLSLTTVPSYEDLQARLDYRRSDWRYSLSTIGSNDGFELYTDKAKDPDKRLSSDTKFLRVTAAAHYHHGPWTAQLALSELPQETDFVFGAVQHLNVKKLESSARAEITRTADEAAGLRDLEWRVGAEVDAARYRLNLALPKIAHDGTSTSMPSAADPMDTSTRYDGVVWSPDLGAWTALTASLAPAIRLTTGLRVDQFTRTNDTSIQPRGQLVVKLAEKWTARLAAGAYRRPADYQDELLHALHPERDTQVISGLELEPEEGVRLQGSVYYTDRTNLLLTNKEGVLANDGRGTTYGAELLATANLGPWFAWLAYSYSHSTRIDYPGATERTFEYDQPHSLNAAASWRHGPWTFGARFELYSGLPYTPVTGSTFASDHDYYAPIYGAADSKRAPLHHQLDLRIDRTWHVGDVALTGFVDVQNVYMNASVSSYGYNFDYSEQYAYKSLPIIPSIGLRGVM